MTEPGPLTKLFLYSLMGAGLLLVAITPWVIVYTAWKESRRYASTDVNPVGVGIAALFCVLEVAVVGDLIISWVRQ